MTQQTSSRLALGFNRPVRLGVLLRESIGQIGAGLMAVALVFTGSGIGSSSLTFGWIRQHDVDTNFFPEFAGGVVYLSDILLTVGIIFWVSARLTRRKYGVYPGPVFVWIPLVALTTLSWLSATWAPDTSVAVWSAGRRTLLLVMYLVIVNEFRRFHWVAVVTLIGFALLQSVVALAQVYQHSAIGWGVLGELRPGALNYEAVGIGRGYGLGFNPNPIGVFAAVGALISYGMLVVRSNGRVMTALLIVVCVATLFGVGATGSRSAIIGLAGGAGGMTVLGFRTSGVYWTRFRPYMSHAVLLTITIGGTFVILASSQGQVQALGLNRFTPGALTSGLDARNQDLSHSYPIIRSTYGIGTGSGNYPLVLKEEIAPGSHSPKLTPTHNVPLLILAELGIAGFVAWVLLAVGPIVWFVVHVLGGRKQHWHSYLWFSPLAVVFIESLFDFTPWATQDGRVLFVAVVALWAGSLRPIDTPSSRSSSGISETVWQDGQQSPGGGGAV